MGAIFGYEYKGWTLYFMNINLKNHLKPHKIYFFSKKQPKSGIIVSVEEFQNLNVEIKENPKTKMPYLKKVR